MTMRFHPLRNNRRGESLIEVMAAITVFLILMGTLGAGIRFAAGALREAGAIRDRVFQFQQSVRRNLADGNTEDGGTGALSFGGGVFTVPVRFLSVPAEAEGQTAVFSLFAARDTPEGGEEP